MRAIEVTEVGGPEVLEVVDLERPEPGPGEVRIDVAAAGINFADIQQRRGHYPGGPTPPFVPGFEAAGRIDAVGDDVSLEPGQRVVATTTSGAYAEAVTADVRSVVPIPEDLSFEAAAGFPVQFLTAHNCLFEWGGLESGERVLIHAAAGGVGTAAVQLAANADAEVFGTASTEAKLDLAADLGCDHPINYETEAFADEIARITDGEGVDLVLDGVGGDAFRESLDVLAHFGRVVAIGVASGDPPGVRTPDLLFQNHSVIGFHLGNAIARDPGLALAPMTELVAGLTEGDIEVVVGHRYPLEQAASAHRLIEGRSSQGKVILRPADD